MDIVRGSAVARRRGMFNARVAALHRVLGSVEFDEFGPTRRCKRQYIWPMIQALRPRLPADARTSIATT